MVSIQDIEYIYKIFRRAQSNFSGRGFRIPKDFEKHFNEKFKEPNKKALIKITGWFLTKWQNIDPYTYFKCGFELYNKNFTYTKFFNDKILLLYITRDKNNKREVEITKKGLVDSAIFVKKWMQENKLNLNEYMHVRNGGMLLAVEHYLNNNIDASFFVFLIRKGMILTDDDRSVIPYVYTNYRKITFGLNDISDFIRKLEEKLI